MNQIDNKRIGILLNSMRWRTINVAAAGRPLFTSDRPVIMSNGLAYVESHLLLPVSPTCLFLATNNPATENQLKAIPKRELVKMCNRYVVRRAQKYAWNRDNSEIDFVRKHLSANSHLETIYWDPRRKSGSHLNTPASIA